MEDTEKGLGREEAEMMMKATGKGEQSITKLVQGIGKDLSKLSEALSGSDAATDKDREQLGSILEQFVDLVENKLGSQEPGEDMEEEESPMMNQMPMQQGRSGVPMGPNTRQ